MGEAGPSRRSTGLAQVVLALTGPIYLALSVFAGLLYGLPFQLDPTMLPVLPWIMHGVVALVLAAVGLLVALLCLVAVVALGRGMPWGRPLALGLAVVFAVSGLLPSAALVALALTRGPDEPQAA